MSDDLSARDAQFVAEMDADAGIGPVAAVYAEALLGAATEAGQVDALLEEYESLVTDVLDANPRFEEVLASAFISHEEKVGIIDRVFAAKATPTLVRFLKVTSKHGRLELLRPIYRELREQYEKQRGRVPVTVTTAAPVDASAVAQLVAGIKQFIDGEPVLEQRVDADLIGGMVVRVGDTVYDASVATQLKNVRQQLVDRSAHEIQSRRDSFRNPTGN